MKEDDVAYIVAMLPLLAIEAVVALFRASQAGRRGVVHPPVSGMGMTTRHRVAARHLFLYYPNYQKPTK